MISALVGNINNMLRRLIGENIVLTPLLAVDLGPISADPGQIEQVLVNLVVNARDAMPDGGRITIETANADFTGDSGAKPADALAQPYVMLAVTDTGTGIDEKTQARLFEPFFTTKELGRGTGLERIHRLRDRQTKRRTGRRFGVLGEGPPSRSTCPGREVRGRDRRGETAVEQRGSETILLVEDDAMVRKFTLRLLTQQGYQFSRRPTRAGPRAGGPDQDRSIFS